MSIIAVVPGSSQPRPFLKWAGGKQRLADRLIEFFPKSFETYYEPFLGGGSVLFSLLPQSAVVADENEWLIDTYRAIRKNWSGVAEILDVMENSKEEYLRLRAVLPDSLGETERAALLIYLNKTCFRGLFRVNKQGQFNVPYGAYDRRYYSAENLAAVSRSLEHVEFREGDFEIGLYGIGTSDFAYLDPPYFKLGGYADFNRYTPGQFREADHVRLAALCRELDVRGVRWALSNSDTALVRTLFDEFVIHEIPARREINLNSGNRSTVELLVTNYDVSASEA